jgi:hypothetical protein
MNGTYGFVYCGALGVGMGFFRITDSELVGCSLAGGRFRGHVAEDQTTGEIDLTLEHTVPAGVALVQGTSPQDVTYIKNALVRVPPGFGDGKPFEVYLAPGNVTLMAKRMSDDWSRYADGMIVSVLPVT